MNRLEHRVGVDRVTAILDDDLSAFGREVRKLRLQLIDPNFVKSSQFFVYFRVTYCERLTCGQNN